MRIRGRLLLTFICFILFCSFLPAQTPYNNINAENDTIRVLLFDSQSVSDISTGAYKSVIKFSWHGKSHRLLPDETNVLINTNKEDPDSLTFYIKGNKYKADTVIIDSDHSSLAQVKQENSPNRYYDGRLLITVDTNSVDSKPNLHIINHTPLESYIGGVIAGEMDFTHPTALKTQAVISRTYALWSMQDFHEKHYDLTDHISNQVFPGIITYKPRFAEAARTTHAEVLTWSNKLIFSPFSSTCGGHTSSNDEVWNGDPLPYLHSVDDHNACVNSPHYRWNFQLEKEELKTRLQNTHDIAARSIGIDSTNSQGRLIRVKLGNVKQDSFITENTMNANKFRLFINNQFGMRSLRSSWFSIVDNGDAILFRGKGMGHGVGLCQWGALNLAKSGWNYRQILKFYYKGVKVVDYHALEHPLRALPLAK